MATTPHITREYFLGLLDEFSDVPAAKLDVYIAEATKRVSRPVWGENSYQLATAYLCAHMLASSAGAGGTGSKGTAGPITAEAVGSLSRANQPLQVSSDADKPFTMTRYGVLYLELRAENVVSGSLTGADVCAGTIGI